MNLNKPLKKFCPYTITGILLEFALYGIVHDYQTWIICLVKDGNKTSANSIVFTFLADALLKPTMSHMLNNTRLRMVAYGSPMEEFSDLIDFVN